VALARLLLVVLLFALACQSKTDAPDRKPSATAPKPGELPALVVKADTPNLLLTWIDDKG